MRLRGKIAFEQKSKPIDGISKSLIMQYINASQCPYCQDGKTYKMLASHICKIHGLSGYELRKELNLNRGHKICDPDYSNKISKVHKRVVKDNKPFLQYDRHTIKNRYEDGGQRNEAIENKSAIALTPERQALFSEVMSKVDRKAIAAKRTPEQRIRISAMGQAALRAKIGKNGMRKLMLYARTKRTPESEKVRIVHAQKTMKEKYWSDLTWKADLIEAMKVAGKRRRRVTDEMISNIFEWTRNGLSQCEIGKKLNISHGRVWQILHNDEYAERRKNYKGR